MVEFQKHYANWKEPNPKAMYPVIPFIWHCWKAKPYGQKIGHQCQGLRLGGIDYKRHRVILGRDRSVLKLACKSDYVTICTCSNSQNGTLKKVNFTVSKLYPNLQHKKHIANTEIRRTSITFKFGNNNKNNNNKVSHVSHMWLPLCFY